jgi:hypothetical protein
MNATSVTELYPYIEDLIGNDVLFALGGYTALVKQGILPDDRDAKDIDLCIFRADNSSINPSFIEENTAMCVDRWSKYKNGYIEELKGFDYRLDFRRKSVSLRDDVDDSSIQESRLRKSLGVDKVASLKLIRLKAKEKPDVYKKGIAVDCGEIIWSNSSNWVTIGNSTQPTQYYNPPMPIVREVAQQPATPAQSYTMPLAPNPDISLADNIAIREEYLRYERERLERQQFINQASNMMANGYEIITQRRTRPIKEDNDFDKICRDLFEEKPKPSISEDQLREWGLKYFPLGLSAFNNFFESNDLKQMEFDLFFMKFDKYSKSTIDIDGITYVHYYTILKAKYEYCLNGMTNEEGFVKHINDLQNSFKVKHIYGVNSPADIEFLIKKRINESK